MKRSILCILLILSAVSTLWAAAPTYFYVVTAVDTNGLESSFSTQSGATLPAQFSSTTCTTQAGACVVSLTWTAPAIPAGGAAIQGYNVYRGTVSGGPYTKINTTLVTGGTSFNDPFVYPNAPTGTASTVK